MGQQPPFSVKVECRAGHRGEPTPLRFAFDGKPIEVKVCKDILVPMDHLKSIRYLKKDSYGRVKKALFEPDQNARIRGQIDSILGEIATEKWSDE